MIARSESPYSTEPTTSIFWPRASAHSPLILQRVKATVEHAQSQGQEENAPPPRVLSDQPADERTHGAARVDGGDVTPSARPRSAGGYTEVTMARDVPNIMASVVPCKRAQRDEHGLGGGQAAKERYHRVAGHARQEHLASAVDVRQPAEGHEEDGGCQEIGGGDPAQRDRVRGELPSDRGDGDIDGRRHERREKGRHGGHEKNDPLVHGAGRRCRWSHDESSCLVRFPDSLRSIAARARPVSRTVFRYPGFRRP